MPQAQHQDILSATTTVAAAAATTAAAATRLATPTPPAPAPETMPGPPVTGLVVSPTPRSGA